VKWMYGFAMVRKPLSVAPATAGASRSGQKALRGSDERRGAQRQRVLVERELRMVQAPRSCPSPKLRPAASG
jgi:hypothetical protein